MKRKNIYFIPTVVTLNRNQIKNLKNIFVEIRKSKKNYLIKKILLVFLIYFMFFSTL